MNIDLKLKEINSKLIASYKEADKHLAFALEGRTQHAAQKIFSQTKDTEVLTVKERVFHFLAAIALSIPLANLISCYFIQKIDEVDLNIRASQVIGDVLGSHSPVTHLPYEIIT